MYNKGLLAALSAAVVLSGAGVLAFAQQPAAKPAPGGEGRSMDQGMMGGDMMGMMHGCERMMGGHAGGAAPMPQLPPGNEKLQLQMHAEMLQRMGEITAKYAERIKEEKPHAR
jgi:hypothetical protein